MTEDRRHDQSAEGLEWLYRRAADAEPDRRTDDAVLGKARKAASRPRRASFRGPGAWGVGLAAAASLVLAVGLVFQYGWQPTPEPERLKQFRARAEMEQAETPSAPAAGDSREFEDAAEPASTRESAELNRVQVTGARSRDEAGRDGQEGRKTDADESRMAAPPRVEEGEQLSPEAWLQRIRTLMAKGSLDEAREELQEFRETHPSTVIPEEIRVELAADSG